MKTSQISFPASQYAMTRRTNSRVSGKGGTPPYFSTLAGPALYAARASSTEPKRRISSIRYCDKAQLHLSAGHDLHRALRSRRRLRSMIEG